MPLIFSSADGAGVSVSGTERPMVFFSQKSPAKDALAFYATPADEPPKNTISWPGEYNVAGVSIRGVAQKEGQQVSYVIESDGVRAAFPSLPLQEWTDQEVALLGEVDVLVLPNDNPKIAQKLIDELDPRVLMLVPDDKGKLDSELLRICGAAGKEHVKEFKLKGSLPQDGREVVVLAA